MTLDQTHPWITFQLAPDRVPREIWTALGEASQVAEWLKYTPLLPEVSRRLYVTYLAKGVFATTSIEGNTLSEDEVQARLAGKLKLPESREYLGREVDNIHRACDEVLDRIKAGDELGTVTEELILGFNGTVLDGLELEEGVIPGEFRTHEVGVGRYPGPSPEHCEPLIGRLCDFLNDPWCEQAGDARRMEAPYAVLKATLAHLYVAWIHPFGDGNGRTARLLEFYLLARAGWPMPLCHLLSNFYNRTRTEYYRQLDYASQSGGDIYQFIAYAVRGLLDEMRDVVRIVLKQERELVWEKYIYDTFGDCTTKADRRRRRLALALPRDDSFVALDAVIEGRAELTRDYALLHARTLHRDLDRLEKMGLAWIDRPAGGVTSAIFNVYRYMPPTFFPSALAGDKEVEATGGEE